MFWLAGIAAAVGLPLLLFMVIVWALLPTNKERSFSEPHDWIVWFSVPINGWRAESSADSVLASLANELTEIHPNAKPQLSVHCRQGFQYLVGSITVSGRSRSQALAEGKAEIGLTCARYTHDHEQVFIVGDGRFECWLAY